MKKKKARIALVAKLRNYFITGVFVLIPIGITLYLTLFLIKISSGLIPKEIKRLIDDGTISEGMLPKINSAVHAAKHKVNAVHIIDGRVEHALLLEILTDQGVGTLIKDQ